MGEEKEVGVEGALKTGDEGKLHSRRVVVIPVSPHRHRYFEVIDDSCRVPTGHVPVLAPASPHFFFFILMLHAPCPTVIVTHTLSVRRLPAAGPLAAITAKAYFGPKYTQSMGCARLLSTPGFTVTCTTYIVVRHYTARERLCLQILRRCII